MSAKSTFIPHFIMARSPQALRLAMLRNNKKWGIVFDYKFIQQMANGRWIAWFYLEAVDSFEQDFNDMVKRGRGEKVDE